MAETKITYGADVAVGVTAWDTSVTAGLTATSAIVDNTSNLFMDLLVGGIIELGASTPVTGDTLDIYIGALYDKDVTSTPGGGIDSLMDVGTPAIETVNVDFVRSNMILFKSIGIETGTPATAQGYQFNPQGCAAFFNGVLPQKIYFALHNNTAGILVAGSAMNSVGITYTTV